MSRTTMNVSNEDGVKRSLTPVSSRNPYTSDAVLDKLIAAGLGNVEQHRITPAEFRGAMTGEMVRRWNFCPTCRIREKRKGRPYCRECEREASCENRHAYRRAKLRATR